MNSWWNEYHNELHPTHNPTWVSYARRMKDLFLLIFVEVTQTFDHNKNSIFTWAIRNSNNHLSLISGEIHGFKVSSALHQPQYGMVSRSISRTRLRSCKLMWPKPHLQNHCIYKPPNATCPENVLPAFPHQSIYAGDFKHDYKFTNDNNGDALVQWVDLPNLILIFNAKIRAPSTRPDGTGISTQICVSILARRQRAKAGRKVLNDFPKSQHRTIMINIGLKVPVVNSVQKPILDETS